jgi:AcrR family transcriptional regulator
MSEEVKGSRPRRRYSSPRREEQARQTRKAILDAAGTLFAERGFAATTMDAVAERAGVATDTVYHVMGSKKHLLEEVLGAALTGDEREVPLLEREEPQRVMREPDPSLQVSRFAQDVAQRMERVRPVDDILVSAAAVDPEIAGLRDTMQLQQRRAAMRQVTESVRAHGGLRPGLDPDRAAVTTWLLTSPEVHRLLRVGIGWSTEEYADWLDDTLRHVLLAAESRPAGPHPESPPSSS